MRTALALARMAAVHRGAHHSSRHCLQRVHRPTTGRTGLATARATACMGLSKEHAAQHPGDALWDAAWAEGEGERTITAHSASAAASEGADVDFFCSWFCPFAQVRFTSGSFQDVSAGCAQRVPLSQHPFSQRGAPTRQSDVI